MVITHSQSHTQRNPLTLWYYSSCPMVYIQSRSKSDWIPKDVFSLDANKCNFQRILTTNNASMAKRFLSTGCNTRKNNPALCAYRKRSRNLFRKEQTNNSNQSHFLAVKNKAVINLF